MYFSVAVSRSIPDSTVTLGPRRASWRETGKITSLSQEPFPLLNSQEVFRLPLYFTPPPSTLLLNLNVSHCTFPEILYHDPFVLRLITVNAFNSHVRVYSYEVLKFLHMFVSYIRFRWSRQNENVPSGHSQPTPLFYLFFRSLPETCLVVKTRYLILILIEVEEVT